MDTKRNEHFPPELGDEFFHRLVLKAQFELRRAGVKRGADPFDVAEDALIGLYQLWLAGELRTTRPEELLRGLAGTMVQRRAIDAGRRERAWREVAAPSDDSDLVGTASALDGFPANGTGSSTRARRLDARDRVGRILRSLAQREKDGPGSDGDYETFVLHYADGLTFQEIAERRGKNESAEAVRSRVRRIEKWIRERVDPSAGAPR